VNEESEQTKVFPTTILLLVLTGWWLSGKLPGSSFPRSNERSPNRIVDIDMEITVRSGTTTTLPPSPVRAPRNPASELQKSAP